MGTLQLTIPRNFSASG